jgi:shikimate dehydrogenase
MQGSAAGAIRATIQPTRLVILGHPVAHSLSPVFQGAALRAAGLTLGYEREDVSPVSLEGRLGALALEGAGGNITIPHKEAAAALILRRTPVARRVGAVNTFWTEQGALVGHNTDVDGAAATIRALVGENPSTLGDVSVVVFGAGGSAAAVLVALADVGCRHVTVVARSVLRARALADRLAMAVRIVPVEAMASVVAGAGLVINATPVGLYDDAFPVPVSLLPADCAVFDLVYRLGGTPWIAACREAGRPAEDGLRMLVEQGAMAFETWFDRPAPRAAMWHALNAAPITHLQR